MTNGEKILNNFPNATTRVCKNKGFTYIEVKQDDEWITDFDMEWWNAEYKEPGKSEIFTGPTTKNCRTCRNFGSHHGICEICKDNKCWTEKEPTTKNCESCEHYGSHPEVCSYCYKCSLWTEKSQKRRIYDKNHTD